MEWANPVVFVLIGAVVGFVIARLTSKTAQQSHMKEELDKTKEEFNQHRQDLVDHFSNSAELLENIYRDYSKLCQIMAKTSTELLPEQAKQDNPFAKRLAHTLESKEQEPIELQEAPRDYSETSSGLLKAQQEKVTEESKTDVATPDITPDIQAEKKQSTEKVE